MRKGEGFVEESEIFSRVNNNHPLLETMHWTLDASATTPSATTPIAPTTMPVTPYLPYLPFALPLPIAPMMCYWG